jgi:uncharacterized UPF0160 family protein
MMSAHSSIPILVTHSGKFHCDDAFAYAVLRLALGLQQPGLDHNLVRTREAEVIAGGSIVWDVGSVYDVQQNRFDHHQRGAPTRADGTPFSSAGLIWQVYGERAVAALGRRVRWSDRGRAGSVMAAADRRDRQRRLCRWAGA